MAAATCESGDRPCGNATCTVGCDGKEDQKMTTKTLKASAAGISVLPALFAVVLGFGIIALTGHVQASALHDAAHDVRHATGFPCH